MLILFWRTAVRRTSRTPFGHTYVLLDFAQQRLHRTLTIVGGKWVSASVTRLDEFYAYWAIVDFEYKNLDVVKIIGVPFSTVKVMYQF
jgi:hypothetical protein